ncbi:molybdopterin-dependent oxidoreductase [Peptococcaceae bacterium 1198_IL3148]
MKVFKSTCPLDCLDSCGLLVHVENDRVVKIEGDADHPITRGFLCSKGYRHLERLYSPRRITEPLLKKHGQWQPVSWQQAYHIIADKLTGIKEKYGSTAVLLHDGAGAGGMLHNLDRRFCNAYGGVTTLRGSICWGSGIAAQEQDFGRLKLHQWDDILNANLIVLWGRDPETTNIHMVPLIRKAVANGAKLMVINPLKIKAAEYAHLHLRPHPGTDGALALAMAQVIIEQNLHRPDFATQYGHNFTEYLALVKNHSPEWAQRVTGIDEKTIREAAIIYGQADAATILLGYGMQRYANGGNTVRAIDALAALTGNIGITGGGINYAHQLWRGVFNDIAGKHLATASRQMAVPTLADEILNATAPPIKAMIVTRSNPVNQMPNINKFKQALSTLDFIVVVDLFMTDTAEMADLVLPCTHFLEEKNLIKSSWNYHLSYCPQVVQPPGICKPDVVIFTELAQHMHLPGFEFSTPKQWLEWVLEPAAANYGITLAKLAQGPITHPTAAAVPFEDGQFETASGKFEFLTAPYQGLHEPICDQYPLKLITAHHKHYMHSQFYQDFDDQVPMEVEINPLEAKKRGLSAGQRAKISSPRGSMPVKIVITDKVPERVALVYQGRWLKQGGGINQLTPDFIPDLGPGTAFYDCKCEISSTGRRGNPPLRL